MAKLEYRDSNKSFVNPYNFVSLSGEVRRDTDVTSIHSGDVKSGYFECSLTAKTPLAIPDVEKRELCGADHYRYPVYSVGGNIIIPASSIRGTIRNVYETITNSCMVTTDGDEQITKRSNLGSFSPCVLIKENGNWTLYKATRVPVVTTNNKYIEGDYNRFKVEKAGGNKESYIVSGNGKYFFGDEVYVKDNGPGHKKRGFDVWNRTVTRLSGKKEDNSFKKGYIFIGEKIFNKHAESVFVNLVKTDYSADDVKAALTGLEITFDMYNNKSINRNLGKDHSGYPGYRRAKGKGAIPLWFKEDNGHLYLSLAAIGRMAFVSNMSRLTVEHQKCSDRTRLCPACAIFGMVGDSKAGGLGYGSKVRFTDCLSEEVSVTNDFIALKELGTPKPSYLKFYSTDGRDYDGQDVTIRGRKYYWHNPIAASDDSVYKSNEKNGRNSSIQLINPGSRFSFKVYFDGLTDEQINKLAWAISLGGNDTNYMHKIGHGKPLGLGSAKVCIDKCFVRAFDLDTAEYSLKENEIDFSAPTCNAKTLQEVLKITDFNGINPEIQICYPYVEPSAEAADYKFSDNDIASHKWFAENNKKGGKTLPSILETSNNPFSAKEVRPEGMGKGGENFANHTENKKNHDKMPLNAEFTKGKEYIAEVTNINQRGTYAYIRLKDDRGNKIYKGCSFKIKDPSVSVNTNVTVAFVEEIEIEGQKKYNFKFISYC